MSKGYTTEAKIENYLLQDIDASFSTQVDNWIEAIEKWIDQYTGRNFIADASATARDYDGNGKQYLLIDDCVEVTQLDVGNDQWGDSQTTVSNSGLDRYFTLPTNNDADEVPINKLGLRQRVFTPGHANHKVTAKWGYSTAVPADIEFAATVLVAGILNHNQDKSSGVIKSEKIGEYQVSYTDEKGLSDAQTAQRILDSYMKLRL